MVGLDVTHLAVLSPAEVETLRGSGRVGRAVAELLDFFGRFHAGRYPELRGAPLHDPVAVAHVLDPGLLYLRPARIDVDCSWGESRGRTNVDWRGRRGGGEQNARVGLGIDTEAFSRLVVDRVASLG
jgi:inosine-uridine nucleoside N-ribohydrolase